MDVTDKPRQDMNDPSDRVHHPDKQEVHDTKQQAEWESHNWTQQTGEKEIEASLQENNTGWVMAG